MGCQRFVGRGHLANPCGLFFNPIVVMNISHQYSRCRFRFLVFSPLFVVGLKNMTCLISGRQTPKYKTEMKCSGRGGTPKLERQDVYLLMWTTGQERFLLFLSA
jgi:hypothetical protein